MSSKFNTSCPSGFPELTPSQQRVKEQWIKKIKTVFENNGFLQIETPLVERVDNLLFKGGNAKEMYVLKRLLDDDNDVSHSGNAFRFDQTVPLALYISRHLSEITFPFKRYVIGPVFRGERAQQGRYRQFDQCDIDIIGSEKLSLINDAQIPVIIIQIFNKLNIGKFIVKINNRKILTGFFASLGLKDDKIKQTLDIVDDLEKLPENQIIKKFENHNISIETGQKILEFIKISGTNQEILNQLELISKDSLFQEGIQNLRIVIEYLDHMKIAKDCYKIDLSIARGLDYYTGTVFETNLIDYPKLGSICSGGRYDDLASVFTGKKLPGVGISIGLSRLLGQLFSEQVIKPERSSPSQVLIIAADKSAIFECLQVGSLLRENEINAENYIEDKKLKKQFDYADKLGIPFCIVIGERELNIQSVNIKDMLTGEQLTIKTTQIVSEIKKLLESVS